MSQPFFRGIIGHEKIQEVLERAVQHDRIAHAYLFVGPEGVGKTTVAEAFLRGLFGGKPLHSVADFVHIAKRVDEKTEKQKTTISVEQIRELKERFALSSFGSGYKAAFIEDADALHPASSNALLKTLEEPSGNAVLVLRASHPESVPATIRSRCQVIRFHYVSRPTIKKALEKKGISEEEAASIAGLALGRPGYAIRFLQDSAFRAQRETAIAMMTKMLDASISERIGSVAKVIPRDEANKGVVALAMLDVWELVLRDGILYRSGLQDLASCRKEGDRIQKASHELGMQTLLQAFERIRESRLAIHRNTNPQLALEHVLLGLS